MAGNALVRLPGFSYQAGWDTTPVSNALTELRKGQEFNARHELDQQRVGLEERRVDSMEAQRKSEQAAKEEDRQSRILGGIAQTIEDTKDPNTRATLWGKLRGSHKGLAETLQKYGMDPSDHVNGPRFLIAQTVGARDPDERAMRRAQTANYEAAAADRAEQTKLRQADSDSKAWSRETRTTLRAYDILSKARDQQSFEQARPEVEAILGRPVRFEERHQLLSGARTAVDQPSYGFDEEGGLIRQPSPLAPRPQQASFVPPSSRPSVEPEPPVLTRAGPGPGFAPAVPPDDQVRRVQAGGGKYEGRLTKDQQRQRTVEELGPQLKDPAVQLSEAEIQRGWEAVYGRRAASGFKYDRHGREVDNKTGGGGDRTRGSILGALEYSQDAIKDAREALGKTYPHERMISHYFDSGTFARANKSLNIAIRGVLHGISGAQINIPEQQEYFNSFRPEPGDFVSTINFKLNHLELVLRNIQKATGKSGPIDEQLLLELRNEMRKGLGIKPLTMDMHLKSKGAAGVVSPDAPPREAPPTPRGGPPQAPGSGPGADPAEIQRRFQKYGVQ